jgi:hypothetical protein
MNGNEPIAHGDGDDSPERLIMAGAATAGSRRSPRSPLGFHQREASREHEGSAAARDQGMHSCDSPPEVQLGADGQRDSPSSRALRQTGASPPEAAIAAARASPRIAARSQLSTEAIDDDIESRGDSLEADVRRQRLRSPQPRTAKEARRASAVAVAHELAADTSRYAVCGDRPELITGLVVEASEARDAGIPHGTATADEWGFAWVRKFCEQTGNVWMRPRASTTAPNAPGEIWFTMLALIWIAQMMRPSARRKRRGYGAAMPTSALLAIYGFRRVMRDCGRVLAEMTEVRRVLKGVCERYKKRWGDDAFVPERKQPFTNAHLLGMIAALVAGVASWPMVLSNALVVALCFVISTGTRKDEWTASFEGDTYVRRGNFVWVDRMHRVLPSTPEVVQSRKNGDMLRGRSAPSKCDRLNTDWGSRDMWFRYDDTNPLNFAWRWQQWELRHPCPEDQRHQWPAFSPSGDDEPFTGGRADGCLRVMMLTVMSAAEAAQRSWHSARVTIATRLLKLRGKSIARDEVEAVIQTLVRWKTLEAARIYARMGADEYADYVDMATDVRVEGGGPMPLDLPEIDPEDVVADHEAAMTAIDAEAAAATKAIRLAAGAPVRSKEKAGRRPAPSRGAPSARAAERDEQRQVFDLGSGVAATHAGETTWDVIGARLRMHNSFWGWDDDEYSACHVVGYIGQYDFDGDTAPSKHTFVVECDGHCYPARHTAVAGAITDPAVRRQVKRTALRKR